MLQNCPFHSMSRNHPYSPSHTALHRSKLWILLLLEYKRGDHMCTLACCLGTLNRKMSCIYNLPIHQQTQGKGHA